ncbi:citryl-CoA lyase [Altericroceibacterium spongiae]|uniref:citrate synthase (unknown stereospecificity) n=1 Tax=Altericroceibacterium spongiae TaxID=2320269 RepID=A0A420EQY3_9SPHN|nr:citryl-CoA lyase [Altericroceibacterium spongiae]RKF23071.1 citryl-CoA lyase [Altericroceibacterium spongiae]
MIRSEIGHTTPTDITLRDTNLATEIIGKRDFVETWVYSALGRWPTDEEKAVLNAILVISLDHGLMPSVLATRLTLLGAPENVAGAVASGLLGAGSRFLGPSATVTTRFGEWTKDLEGDSPAEAFEAKVDTILEEQAQTRKIIPGYGHPIHKHGDPRVAALREVAKQNGFYRKGWRLADALQERLAGREKPWPMNAAGGVGVTVFDMQLDSDFAAGLSLVARCAGLMSHIMEERKNPIAQEVWQMAALQDERVDYGHKK